MNIRTRAEAKESGLKRFFTGRPCMRGHIVERNVASGVCIQCDNERSKNRDQTQHRETSARWAKVNGDRRRAQQRETWPERKKKHAEKRKAYYARTREHQIAKAAANYKANQPERNKAQGVRRRANPIKWIARSLVSTTLKRIKQDKCNSTETILGYSSKALKLHLEKLFKDGMTWTNHGDWHVDHVKPVNAFIKEGITDMKLINSLSNLQPLWAAENLSKQAKWELEND